MNKAKRAVICIFLFAAIAACSKRGQPPNVNERSLMRGARCTIVEIVQKPPYGLIYHEDIFGDVATMTVTKTTGGPPQEWVIMVTDTHRCTLSFWLDDATMDKELPVRDITSY